MTYEEAMRKVKELNEQGWALTITQGLGRRVESEFYAGFIYFQGASSPGEFYGNTIPEAIGLAAAAAEGQMAKWTHESIKR
jgi:hypothetical protein